jgi:hypothetical protein
MGKAIARRLFHHGEHRVAEVVRLSSSRGPQPNASTLRVDTKRRLEAGALQKVEAQAEPLECARARAAFQRRGAPKEGTCPRLIRLLGNLRSKTTIWRSVAPRTRSGTGTGILAGYARIAARSVAGRLILGRQAGGLSYERTFSYSVQA